MDASWSIVDVREIAAVAVAALGDPAAHGGRAYTVTGPEASSPRDQVAIISDVLGRSLRAKEVTIEQAQQAMLSSGWPQWSDERRSCSQSRSGRSLRPSSCSSRSSASAPRSQC
jgi:uncharacterized protein YbjT (DUF2867 family)